MKKYIDWSNKTFPLTIQPRSKTIEILNKGFVYVYGRDCKFRPLLIFRLVEFVKYENIYSVEEVLNAGIFLGQFCINNLLAPGHVERWDLIIDLRKTTLLGLPDHIKKLLPIMNEGFISRLNKTYVIGMNFFFRIIYKIVCAFLQESTVKKIKILDGKKDQSMFEEIRRDNVEVDMGGTAPNARIGEENGIFPPRMPSEHFLLESQKEEDILISEEEYINKYKNGEIPKDLASPYILNKLEEMKKQESIIENNNINDPEDKNLPNLFEDNEENFPAIKFEVEFLNPLICLLSDSLKNLEQEMYCIKSEIRFFVHKEKISDLKKKIKKELKTYECAIKKEEGC